MKDTLLRPAWNITAIFICTNKNKSAADLPCIKITSSCKSHSASESYVPLGAPAMNRAEFRDCCVQKFITSILSREGKCSEGSWRKASSTESRLWAYKREIIRAKELKKATSILHDTNCWVTSRALCRALLSPRHKLMASQAVPVSAAQPLTKMLVCRAGYNLLLDRRSSIFISQKSSQFVLLPAVQIICPEVLSTPSPAVGSTQRIGEYVGRVETKCCINCQKPS